jgi:large conductance mechanosensitive channel
MSLIKEFREFAMKGSVVDLAVGVVIGTAFGKIVGSFVSNIIMPPINLLTAKYGVDFSQYAITYNTESPKLDAAGAIVKDATGNPEMVVQDYPILNVGPFVQTVFDFLLVAAAIFIAVKIMNTAKARFEKEKAAAPPAPPAEDILLLREIRDSLKR